MPTKLSDAMVADKGYQIAGYFCFRDAEIYLELFER